MNSMFHAADSFNGDLSTWDVSSVTTVFSIFNSADSFNGDLSTWDMSRVTTVQYMFHSAVSFNGDLSTWDVSSVLNMDSMFIYTDSFNGDLSTWDVSNVLNMSRMFQNAVDFNKLLCGDSWIESSANMFLMFDGSGGGAIGNEICVCNTPGEVLADGVCLVRPPSSPSSDGDGLSGGDVAGIVIGVYAGLGLCISAAAYTALKLKRRKMASSVHMAFNFGNKSKDDFGFQKMEF
jgi:surface protein